MIKFDTEKFNLIKRISYMIVMIFLCFFLIIYVYIQNNFRTRVILAELNKYFLNEINKVNKHYNYKDKELKFQVNGSVKLKIFPDVKIIINNVELKNVRYNDYLISGTVKTIEITLSFWDVLQKNININNVFINGGQFTLEYDVAEEFYFKKVKVKKIVKLEENEVIGIKSRLKEILTNSEDSQQVKEGYKEILVEQDEKVMVDNGDIKNLFTNMIFNIKFDNVQHTNFTKGTVNFADININLVKNSNIDKEYKNITGILLRTNKSNYEVQFSLLMGGIDSNVNFSMSKKSGETIGQFKIVNTIEDSIAFNVSTKSNIENLTKLFYVDGNKKISFSTKSLNKMAQWILPTTVIMPINYNGEIEGKFDFTTVNNMKNIDFKEISVKSNDIIVSGNMSSTDGYNTLNLDIEKINFDNFVIEENFDKDKTEKQKKIIGINITPDIFNISNLDELNDFIVLKKNKDKNSKEYKVNLNIKELISNEKTIKDSTVSFSIIDNMYYIDNFNLNIDNNEIIINNRETYKDIVVNDLTIKGADIRTIAKNFYIDNFVNFNEFEMKAKFVAFRNAIYIIDATINNDNQNITGDFELKLLKDGYIAGDLHFDKINYDTSQQQQIKIKTLKEKLLILNNIKDNVFLKLSVDDFNYVNVLKNTKLISYIHFKNGVFDMYDIKDISNNIFQGLTGNIIFDISGAKPKINANLKGDFIKYNVNLLEIIMNINKYKSAIFEDSKQLPELENYWVNKIFEVPTLEDINGYVNFNFNKGSFNGEELTNIILNSKINDGSIQIDNFSFAGIGGKTNIKGTIGIKDSKSVDLALSDSVYNIKNLNKFIIGTDNNIDIIDGTLGIRGVIKAHGYDRKSFLSTMNLSSDFIGKQLYIKKIGLENLQKVMNNKTTDFKNIQLNQMILDDSGTTFKDFKGNLSIKNNLLVLKGEATADLYSSNLLLKIDNNGNKPLFNFNNISSFIFVVGEEKKTPFYYSMNFVEDFSGKAYLKYDLTQVEELLKILKNNQLTNEKQQQ